MLPWLQVPQNKVQRARVNAAYGAPLVKTYPRGVFFASSTNGAPGQVSNLRVYKPGQNQVGDPRAAQGFYDINTAATDLTKLFNPVTNVGGNLIQSPNTDYSPFLLIGLVGLVIWSVLK